MSDTKYGLWWGWSDLETETNVPSNKSEVWWLWEGTDLLNDYSYGNTCNCLLWCECNSMGYSVNFHQVIKPGVPGNEAVTLMKFSSTWAWMCVMKNVYTYDPSAINSEHYRHVI